MGEIFTTIFTTLSVYFICVKHRAVPGLPLAIALPHTSKEEFTKVMLLIIGTGTTPPSGLGISVLPGSPYKPCTASHKLERSDFDAFASEGSSISKAFSMLLTMSSLRTIGSPDFVVRACGT
jgi:hypothetical protein